MSALSEDDDVAPQGDVYDPGHSAGLFGKKYDFSGVQLGLRKIPGEPESNLAVVMVYAGVTYVLVEFFWEVRRWNDDIKATAALYAHSSRREELKDVVVAALRDRMFMKRVFTEQIEPLLLDVAGQINTGPDKLPVLMILEFFQGWLVWHGAAWRRAASDAGFTAGGAFGHLPAFYTRPMLDAGMMSPIRDAQFGKRVEPVAK